MFVVIIVLIVLIRRKASKALDINKKNLFNKSNRHKDQIQRIKRLISQKQDLLRNKIQILKKSTKIHLANQFKNRNLLKIITLIGNVCNRIPYSLELETLFNQLILSSLLMILIKEKWINIIRKMFHIGLRFQDSNLLCNSMILSRN